MIILVNKNLCTFDRNYPLSEWQQGKLRVKASQSEAEITDDIAVDKVANDARQTVIGNESELMNECVRERKRNNGIKSECDE